MKAKMLGTLVLGTALTFTLGAAAAPPAREYKSAVTSPTGGTAATIKITKASRAGVKVGTGSVTFYLKLSGVVDTVSGDPVDLNGNTFSVQYVVNGLTQTKNFLFNIAGGKTSPATAKFPQTNGDVFATAMPGDPVEIQRVRVIQAGTGQDFGVAGITLK